MADAAALRRAEWFERVHAANAPPQAASLPEAWVSALEEMKRAYCAGAWAATVVLAFALAEAAERRGAADDAEFEWLRERRNRVAHLGDDYPGESELEVSASGAIRISLRLAYAAAWR